MEVVSDVMNQDASSLHKEILTNANHMVAANDVMN
jgi:hypothetical protein